MKEYEIRYSELTNGVRHLEIPIPHAETTACVAFVKTGSRNENFEKESGISHLLEHVVYHGTKRHRSQDRWLKAVDKLGPDQNAATDYEYTEYYIHVGSEHAKPSIKLLGDLITQPLIDPKAVRHEKGYIPNETVSENNVTEDLVSELFEQLLFEGSALSNPVNGREDILARIRPSQVRRYKEKWYRGGNILVVVAGKVGRIRGLIEDSFGSIPNGPMTPYIAPSAYGGNRLKIETVRTRTNDVFFVLGFPGLSLNDPRYYALKTVGVILGGNDSVGTSLLYQDIQTKSGSTYDITSYVKAGSDYGYLAVQGSIAPDKLEDLLDSVRQKTFRLSEKIRSENVQIAKAFLEGELKRDMENTLARAEGIGLPALLFDKVESRAKMVRKIRSVSVDEVKEVVAELIRPDEERLLVFGPVNEKLKRVRKFNSR